MIRFVKRAVILLFSCTSLTVLAHAQDIPAVTGPVSYQGFQLPDSLGSLSYALSASEALRSGYYSGSGAVWSSNISGDLAYLSKSDVHPFNLLYSGGYIHTSIGLSSSVFQSLTLSQSLKTSRWNFTVADAIRYMPDAPVSGLSGVAGLGDLGIAPPDSNDDQDILTGFAQRVTNTVSASASRQITGSTSLQGSGSYYIQRFLEDSNDHFSTNQVTGGGGLNHRIDALSSATVNYSYSNVTYPADNFSFVTQGINFGYNRQFSRRLTLTSSIGPQKVNSGTAGTPGGSSYNLAVNAVLTYLLERGSANVSFIRGVQSGSGVVQGAISETLAFSASRELNRLWHGGFEGNYSKHTSINVLTTTPFSLQSVIASAQISRVISRSLSAFASYSAQEQSTSTATRLGVFSGLSQTISVGITYSSQAIHLGHQ
jgi:hypothetical protein